MEGYISKGSLCLSRRSSLRSGVQVNKSSTDRSTVRRLKSPLKAILDSLKHDARMRGIG